MLKFENKSNGRYYYISSSKDLFGDISIKVMRGSKSKNILKTIGCRSKKEAFHEIHKIIKRRIQRGYTLLEQ